MTALDFNRCDGTLSNEKFYPYDSSYSGWGGVVTSPNSRYLYLLAGNYVSQFDLQADDLFASRQTVATYDGGVSPLPTRFFQAHRAPDGKIYAVSTNTNNILHVIHHPDEPGIACQVEQRGLTLPALTDFLFLNWVNYRLDSLSHHYCDSLTSSVPGVHLPLSDPLGLDVYPNPADDEATFEQLGRWAGLGGHLQMSDLSGRLLWQQAFQPGEAVLRWSVSRVPPGLYVWSYVRADGRRRSGRVAVQH
ncbi:MAG TPA: T9SS type A sorting domain-containing protein [Saprospiraceae bacterium]|nr:T9SS type A sorting domain-containing protein [Saprospiraceae bacterium]HND90089.1 T9SS type A sorting domain-containing protein [Saprospiraceae bacterium]